MFIKYDEYELLELFESEPTVISEGMFIYTKRNSKGLKVVLSLSVYENECDISLCLDDDVIFESSLKDVEYLYSESNSLRLHQTGKDKDYIIHFKDSFLVKIE